MKLGATSAVAAGLTDKPSMMADVAAVVDDWQESLIQKRRASLLVKLPQSN
jgi:hypothetical protein